MTGLIYTLPGFCVGGTLATVLNVVAAKSLF